MTDTPGSPPQAGIYRHYKGQHYLVLGLAHDANADTLGEDVDWSDHVGPARVCPLEEREVVVYVPLEFDGAHAGASMAVRTLEDWNAVVCALPGCPRYGDRIGPHPDQCALRGHAVHRFRFVGERWSPT